MEIQWKASFSASCLHAVLCAQGGFAAIDSELAQLLAEPSAVLLGSLIESQVPVLPALRIMSSLASSYENNRQLVELTLTRLRGPARLASKPSVCSRQHWALWKQKYWPLDPKWLTNWRCVAVPSSNNGPPAALAC